MTRIRANADRARAALVLFLVALPGVARAAKPAAEIATEQQAIAALVQLGGVMMRSEQRPSGRTVVAVNFNGHALFQDDWLKALLAMPNLNTLRLAGTSLGDAGLAHVKKLDKLETLFLVETKITDAGLAELKGLKSLRRLDVSGTAVTAAGVAALRAALPTLEITAEGLSQTPPASPTVPPEKSAPSSSGQPVVFPAAKIKTLREQAQQAVQLPENTPAGWSKSHVDPARLVALFKPLEVRQGFALRAYQFQEEGNGNGFVWAMPADAEFPQPKDCPVLENHLLKAPKPSEALDDVMEAIEGDNSPWSYLAASMLRREMSAFGAIGHGSSWLVHHVLGENPWKAGPPKDDSDPISVPQAGRDQFQWTEEPPKDWNPSVQVTGDRVIVTFYTYSGLETQAIYRHTDTYRAGKYRPKVEQKRVAEGPPGFMF